MKSLIQRVSRGSVSVEGEVVGRIAQGLVVLLGVKSGGTEQDVEFLARKTVDLRVFADDSNRMNLSVRDIGGEMLIISQFTLYADTRKGNRPGFTSAADPEHAEKLYKSYVESIRRLIKPKKVATGVFGAMMEVNIINDGPVTLEICTDNS